MRATPARLPKTLPMTLGVSRALGLELVSAVDVADVVGAGAPAVPGALPPQPP